MLVNNKPDRRKYDNQNDNNYAEIMVQTNALKRNYNPNETQPRANKSWKWNNLLKDIWEHRNLFAGEGIMTDTQPIVLPRDPNALVRDKITFVRTRSLSNAIMFSI